MATKAMNAIKAAFDAYKSNIEEFLDADNDKNSKTWNDVIFVVFNKNKLSKISELEDLAFAFNDKFNPDVIRINLDHVSQYFKNIEITKSSITKFGLIKDKHFRIDESDIYVSFDGLSKLIESSEDVDLVAQNEFIEMIYDMYENYKIMMNDRKLYPTHWALFKPTKEEDVVRIISGGYELLQKRIDNINAGKTKIYSLVSETPYESVLFNGNIEIDILAKYINTIMKDTYDDNAPILVKGKKITFVESDNEYSVDNLIEEIERFRQFISSGTSPDNMDFHKLSKKHRTRLDPVRKALEQITTDFIAEHDIVVEESEEKPKKATKPKKTTKKQKKEEVEEDVDEIIEVEIIDETVEEKSETAEEEIVEEEIVEEKKETKPKKTTKPRKTTKKSKKEEVEEDVEEETKSKKKTTKPKKSSPKKATKSPPKKSTPAKSKAKSNASAPKNMTKSMTDMMNFIDSHDNIDDVNISDDDEDEDSS